MGQILLTIIGFILLFSFPWIVIPIGIGYLLIWKMPDSFGTSRRGSDRSLGTGTPETRQTKPLKVRKAPSWLWGPEKAAFESGVPHKPIYSDDPEMRKIQEQTDLNRQKAQEEMRRDIEREYAEEEKRKCRGQNLGGA